MKRISRRVLLELEDRLVHGEAGARLVLWDIDGAGLQRARGELLDAGTDDRVEALRREGVEMPFETVKTLTVRLDEPGATS